MRQITVIGLVWVCGTMSVFGQYEGANNAAMGVHGVATAQLFSANINPANLSLLDSAQVGVNVKKWNFAGNALESVLQTAIPFQRLKIGAGLYNFGNSFYNFGKLNFAIAKPLDKHQGIGVSFDLFREFVYLNSDATAINASVGYYYSINEKLRLGAAIRHVFYRSNQRFEQVYSQVSGLAALGLSYQATSSLSFTGELRTDELNPMGLGLGMQLQKEKFALLGGFSNQENLINAGLSLPIGPMHWTISYAFHQQLGSTIQTSLRYQW